jgi:hypothetical protein
MVSACASKNPTFEHEQYAAPVAPPARKLTMQDSFYIMHPENGRFGNTHYTKSGQMRAQMVTTAFRAHAAEVETAVEPEPRDAALEHAVAAGQSCVVEPVILHWEDRATEWSAKPDRMQVRVTVIEAATGDVISEAVMHGTSKWATFGGDHPQELLPKPLNGYVASLF